MRLLVLAAGKGTRLKPYTNDVNKSMISIAGYPLLYYNLMQCSQISTQVTEIVIVVGYRKEQIRKYFGNTFMGMPIKYVVQEKLDGIAGAVALASPLLEGEPFIMTLGDELLWGSNLPAMVTSFLSSNSDGFCGVLCGRDAKEIQKNYSLHLSETGSIDKLVEKPSSPFNDMLGLGYCVFSASTLPFAKKTPISTTHHQRGMCDWIMLCIKNGLHFYPYIAGKNAINLNNPDDLIILENNLLRGDIDG